MTQLLFVRDGEFVLKSDYNASLVMDCRNIPGRTWEKEDKTNRFPLISKDQVVALANKWDIPISPEIVGMGVPAETLETHYGLEITDSGLEIRFDYDAGTVLATKSMVIDSKWDRKNLVWKAPLSSIDGAIAFCARFGFSVAPEVAEIAQEAVKRSEEMIEASHSLVGTGMDVGSAIPLKPFQEAGVAYLQRVKRALLCDEMGVGKSFEALATAVSLNKFPIAIVASKTLKLNWPGQIEKFYPGLSYTVVNGGKPEPISPADVIIINFDILHRRADDMIALKPKSLIGDEIHAIRNGEAKHYCPAEACQKTDTFKGTLVRANSRNCPTCRAHYDKPLERWNLKKTDGFMRLAQSMDPDDVILLLSGTITVNRNDDLIAPLTAIGRMGDFGGVHRFKARYCGPPDTNLDLELHARLRSTCMLRRLKKDIYTELPPVTDCKQFLDITPDKMRYYAEIENDVVEFVANRAAELALELGEDPRSAYIAKRMMAERSEAFLRIGTLRQAAVDIKYDAVIDWIETFFEDSDEKLIVFGEQIKMVESVVAHFGEEITAKIRGSVSGPNRMKECKRFQEDPRVKLFVGNMQATSEGLDLTASSNVAFLSLPWTPSMVSQCIGRAYGRVADLHGCTAYYLLAPHTIDEDIFGLLMAKKAQTEAVSDGKHPDEQTGSLAGEIMQILGSRGQRMRIDP